MTASSLHNDLERLTSGEVHTDPVTREIYATAACIYRILPRAVVCPKRPDEVAAIVAYARDRGIPVTARGAGSAVAGQTLGSGIIVDFMAHLNKIVSVDYKAREAVVQPGVILGRLNLELAEHGLRFPPDPSSGDYATIGGMIANNSSGAHSLKYGDTRKWTLLLKAVLSDGSVEWLSETALPIAAQSKGLDARIREGLPRLLAQHKDAIESSRPRVSKNSSGYHVWDLVSDKKINLVPLIVGSEGTLAVVIEAVLRLDPVPAGRAAALLGMNSLDQACEAINALLPLKPSALEIMDRLFISIVREHRPELQNILPQDAQAVLLVEFEASDNEEALRLLDRAREVCKSLPGDAVSIIEAGSGPEIDALWEIRKAASPILYRLPGRRLTRFVEDVVIPPERLGEGITKIQEILERHGTQAPILGHAGSGNLHLNPRLDLTDPEDCGRMRKIADEIYELVIELGGTITGEHGDGMLRAPYVKRQFPKLLPLFREIKKLFDPEGILNPGKIFSDEHSMPIDQLFLNALPRQPDKYPLLHEDPYKEMLLRCQGCGLCRTYCPVVKVIEDEPSLPRSKVSLARAIALGDLDLSSPEVKQGIERAFSLCTSCQRCVTGCPTGIEPAALIRAFFSDHFRLHGRPFRERMFANAPLALSARSKTPRAAVKTADSSIIRGIMEAGLGIRKKAPFPLPSGDTLKSISKNKAGESGAGTVVFFPGCLGRYADNDGETKAALEVLFALGYDVIVPDLSCCGAPNLAAFDLEGAKKAAGRMVEGLKKYTRENIPIVTACPSCALYFQHEYGALIGREADRLSSLGREFFRFLSEIGFKENEALANARSPLEKVILHRPCHHAGLSKVDFVGEVLELVPGLEVTKVDVCCGLAGPHALRVENAPVSEALAGSFLRAVEAAGAGTVISSCPGCRTQIKALGLECMSAVAFVNRSLRKS